MIFIYAESPEMGIHGNSHSDVTCYIQSVYGAVRNMVLLDEE